MARTHKSAAIRVRIEASLTGASVDSPPPGSARVRPEVGETQKKGPRISPRPLQSGIRLRSELDRKAHVEEPANLIIRSADGVVLANAVFQGKRRILVEQVVDAEGDE